MPTSAPPSPAVPELLLMEGSLFWNKYKLPVVAAVLLLALALVAFEVYEMGRDKKIHAASMELDSAKTPADFRHVMATYPGTMAAANAALLLGRTQFDAKDYAGAASTWQQFADSYPQHALAPVALVGAGTALEASGKTSEARGLYQRASTSYQNSFAAPLARLDEAALLKAEQKPEEARRVYENIMASNASSDAARQAEAELRYLHVTPSAPGTALLPGALALTPALAPSPSPAASPASVPVGSTTVPVPHPPASPAAMILPATTSPKAGAATPNPNALPSTPAPSAPAAPR